MSGRVILHSDMNCFYASVEMALHHELRGKAVAVCGSTETRHGIVLAKSEKAKKAGVKTGMANWEALELCPNLIIVPPHFEEYLKFSKLAHSLYLRYTDFVEPYGMDECFLDVTGSVNFGSGEDIAKKISLKIKEELGVTVSVGVSFNKVFAKLGSEIKKPDAITTITEDNFREKVWPLPASDLFFVGKATTQKLRRYGINTIGELASLPPEFLQNLFGKNGLVLWRYANGLDASPVMRKDFSMPIKSIGHGITCISDLTDLEKVWLVMLELSQDIGHKLRVNGMRAGGVQIFIKDSKLEVRQFQGKLLHTSTDPMLIAAKAKELFIKNYHWEKPVRAITVRAIDLHDKGEPEQADLFSNSANAERGEKLFDCVEEIRKRYGKRSLYSASLMGDLNMPSYRDHEIILPGIFAK